VTHNQSRIRHEGQLKRPCREKPAHGVEATKPRVTLPYNLVWPEMDITWGRTSYIYIGLNDSMAWNGRHMGSHLLYIYRVEMSTRVRTIHSNCISFLCQLIIIILNHPHYLGTISQALLNWLIRLLESKWVMLLQLRCCGFTVARAIRIERT
jgi:hypothetical protein